MIKADHAAERGLRTVIEVRFSGPRHLVAAAAPELYDQVVEPLSGPATIG